MLDVNLKNLSTKKEYKRIAINAKYLKGIKTLKTTLNTYEQQYIFTIDKTQKDIFIPSKFSLLLTYKQLGFILVDVDEYNFNKLANFVKDDEVKVDSVNGLIPDADKPFIVNHIIY